jgi:predicted  nucleic acid-binding Zn-ribbon protein
VKAEIEQLVALQKTDLEIRRLESELTAIPQRRAEIENEFDQRAFEIKALEQQRDEAQQERIRLETELAETRHQAERAERNLMSSKKQDEYTAAIREADSARKHISKLEEQVLEKMEAFDQAVAALKEREPEVEKLRGEMQERIKSFEAQVIRQEAEVGAVREKRDALLAQLPKNLSSMYKRISTRIRDGVAVAEARNGSCTACFMSLRPQMMSEVRRGDEIITCDNCSRILYWVPTEKREQSAAPAATVS